MNKAVLYVSIFVAAVMLALTIGVSWMLLEPIRPVISLSVTYATDEAGNPKNEFRSGEKLFYFREGNLLRNVPRTVYQTLIYDKTGVTYVRLPPASPVISKTGPFKHQYYALTLPEDLLEGDWTFDTLMVYSVNVLRPDAEQKSASVKFRIVK